MQHSTVVSWRFVVCRFQIALAHHSFQTTRDYESTNTRNLNAILICLTSCSISDKLSTEHKERENTRLKTCEYFKSNLLFENIYQFKETDALSISEGQRPVCY